MASSRLHPRNKYDAFLSFRGEDTRDNFTSHLYSALSRKNIETFIDNQLVRGDEISESLLDAIEASTVSVIIFSQGYASSTWCLDELLKILDCKNNYQQIVIPIFFGVDPSHVRNQTGSFGDSFSKLEERFKDEFEKLQSWRIALKEAANLSGYDSHVIRSECKLTEEICNDILKRLNDRFQIENKDLIGVESRIKKIESLLDCGSLSVRKLGIWGIGGIGKTTIANAIFQKISNQFEGSCFIQNVREESEKTSTLAQLQEKLFSTLLDDVNVKIGVSNMGLNFRTKRLRHKKVLIVFDDVTRLEQIESLIGDISCFGGGSRIIITTRDKHVLRICRVDEIYEVQELSHDNALKLFSRHAFEQNYPKLGYTELSNEVLKYVQGVPLALKVLGRFLFKRSEEEWESAINKLKKIPHADIHNVLKVSYDGLDDEEQSIFLDIASFFKGENKDFVIKFLNGCGFSAQIGISDLVDKALIIVSNGKITMHDLLQQMGREIVRQESFKDPGKRSRLWHHEDIYQVLTKNKGTEAIEGICLDMSKVNEIRLTSSSFAKMTKLRFLKFYGRNKFKVSYFQGEGLTELRYLCWDGYPSKSFPSVIHPENLVSLEMPWSNIKQLWNGVQDLVNLIKIDLSDSKLLTKLPDLSQARNLEKLHLDGCSSLVETHPSIQHLKKLVILDLSYCVCLNSLPTSINSEFISELYLRGCSNLKKVPEISSCNIKELCLDGTAIKELPSSIECLSRLFSLELINCKMFESLPRSICKLKCLQHLTLSGSLNLKRFPEISSYSIKKLHLDGTGIEELPSSIECLSSLVTLDLRNCSKLEHLPRSIFMLKDLQDLNLSCCSNLKRFPEVSSCNIIKLHLDGTAIEELPSSIECLSGLVTLNLMNCSRLEHLPGSIFKLKCLHDLNLSGCINLKRFPEMSSCNITFLYLDGTAIEELPSSIECLSNLVILSLSNCKRLESLPSSLYKLEHLQDLYLDGCSNLQRLPDELGNLENSEALYDEENCCNRSTSVYYLSRDAELMSKWVYHCLFQYKKDSIE